MTEPTIDYDRMVRRALRDVVRQALALVAEHGLPGEHHFFLDLDTTAEGVEMPDWLRQQHPETLRIVLQNQFWNLAVSERDFSVDLRFGGVPATIAAPFSAITVFVDPAQPFGLRFVADDENEDDENAVDGGESDAGADAGDPAAGDTASDAEVVSLDAFRKR